MKKHLKYIDDTSDKFWQIEVSGAQYTVTYGKNGTNGSSQVKQFADEDICLKTAEKLLAEKIKKGYSENGNTISIDTTKVSLSKKNSATEILALYDSIVKTKSFEKLLPFLKENSKGNLEVLKKQIKSNKRFWMSYIDLKAEPQYLTDKKYTWGTRGDKNHSKIITLSAIAIFNKADITSWDEAIHILDNPEEPYVLEILNWARPAWVADFLLDKIKKQDWTLVNYLSLRFLEEHNLVEYNAELYAICLARYSSWTSEKMPVRNFINYITSDEVAYKRDVPQLFNYETNVQNNGFRDNESQNYNQHLTWVIVFNDLVEQNKLDRNTLIENIILIQTKDWNSNLRAFFRKILAGINPLVNELIPFQENIFAALHNPLPAITNYAVDLIKKIYENKEFAATSFIEWLEPLMMRSDCKAAIKNAMPVLEKLNKLQPELNSTIMALLANVYVIPDLSLQEKVTKLIIKIGNDTDNALTDKLQDYIPLMQGNVKADLVKFIKDETVFAADEPVEVYQYTPLKEKVLIDEIELPQNWNDILYLFGSFISSDEVSDPEVLLNVFITKKHLFPPDYSSQLQPYAKQLQNRYFSSTNKSYISVFLQQKISDLNYNFKVVDSEYDKINTVLLIKPILHAVQDKMTSQSAIPLLSLPTHKPAWVAPKVLLERLIAYQNANESINRTDLSIAISRMSLEKTDEALPLLDQLTGELKSLMSFCLGTTKNIGFASSSKSLFNKLLSKLGAPANPDNIALWSVAARTFYPQETFTAFENTYLKDTPFAVTPFNPHVRLKECWNEYVDYQTKKKVRTASWYELGFDAPLYKKVSDYLLYSLDVNNNKKSWAYILTPENVYYWHSLMPQNNDALALFLLKTACTLADGSNAELKSFLTVINLPGFTFSNITLFVFACCFFQEKKDVRMLASEVLINLIQSKKIDTILFAQKLAYLASNKYGAFSRLSDSLASVKDVSGLHNSALLQIMEEIFKELEVKDKLPANFKRIIENYVDLLYKNNCKPSQQAVVFFEKYKENASLKALIKQILN